MHTELRKVTYRASRRGYNQPSGQGCAVCPMHRRRARGTRYQCSETAYHIKRVSGSVLSSGLARVEIHALQRESALCVQPERQPHHWPNYIVAPCVFVSASCLAMQCFLKIFLTFLKVYSSSAQAAESRSGSERSRVAVLLNATGLNLWNPISVSALSRS